MGEIMMNKIGIFAEWMRRQGHSIIETPSSYWTIAGTRAYQAIPYYGLITPSEEEVQELLLQNRAFALRYSTSVDAPLGALSYHVVYERSEYSLKNLPKKARYDVKKGLSVANIEPIPFARLATDGWKLRLDTLIRQGRKGAETESWWQKLCQTAEELQAFEAWGAIVDGKLVACLLSFQSDDYYCILYQQSHSDFLRFGVNNALAYTVTSEVLLRPEAKHIFYGLHSLDASESVDEFKFRMGFQAKPVRQRVEFYPHLRPFVNKFSYKLLKIGHDIQPNNHLLSKAEGMFRFYLNGKLPVTLQVPPVPLVSGLGSEIDE
jgi:hypothetical protein